MPDAWWAAYGDQPPISPPVITTGPEAAILAQAQAMARRASIDPSDLPAVLLGQMQDLSNVVQGAAYQEALRRLAERLPRWGADG